jgi:hypothetical protein
MYRLKHTSFTFEESIQRWIQTILLNGSSSDFHAIATSSPAAALPQFLRASNEHLNVSAGLVSVAALVNIGACDASNILECFQQFNPDGTPDFEAAILTSLMHLHGPRGPYLKDDLKFARSRRVGPVYDILQKRAIKAWSVVLFAIVIKRLWRSFLEHVLRPDSGYVKRVLLVRCRKNC